MNPNLILPALGITECAIAAWVLTGWRGRTAAAAQTALLIGMNAAGILWARTRIEDPVGMLLQNGAFLTLAWVVAKERSTDAK